MAMVVFGYLGWLLLNPFHFILGIPIGSILPIPIVIVLTVVYIPMIYYIVRYWLRTMTKRKSGPASGIDTVEAGPAKAEDGDQWGRASMPYKAKHKSKVIGSKSEIRDPPVDLGSEFFTKTPDLDTGEPIFDVEELKAKAMIRSKITSGGWINKRVSSRGVGSLKASETAQYGRPIRSRQPTGDLGSIDLPATIVRAIGRTGKLAPGQQLEIKSSDIREKVFTGHTPLTILLVIDVSLSMKSSRKQIRKLLERIERETRGSKDRTGIVAFKESGAIEVQAPTTNWNKIYRALSKLRISGLTPLAEAVMKSLEIIKRERMRNRDIEPLIVIISDFAPNIPLAQSVGPGHLEYTPVRDIVRAARIAKKSDVRIATVNVDPSQMNWIRFLKRPYHEALELATMLRMKKEGFDDPIETILSVHEFRQTFGAYLIAKVGGGKCFLSKELLKKDSILSEFISGAHSKSTIRSEDLKAAESYIT
ncbi:MAG: VWA domain-containing protein [Candidatus Lokiarchaeota archaeon]|nr:VWA domain-containing protein [Candidatus Lokiarchaeota archaeon]